MGFDIVVYVEVFVWYCYYFYFGEGFEGCFYFDEVDCCRLCCVVCIIGLG